MSCEYVKGESFKDEKELILWVSNNRPHYYQGDLYTINSENFYIINTSNIGFYLKAIQKPEKKKIFALHNKEVDLVIFSTNKDHLRHIEGKSCYEKDPDYDIEYD